MNREFWGNILDEAYGAGDAALTIGSGIVAEPLSGLYGLGVAGANQLGLTDYQGADAVRDAQSAMTWEPGAGGQQQLGRLGSAIQSGLDYQPPLRDQSIGQDLQAVGDYWRDTSVPALQDTFGDELGAGIGATGLGILGAVGGPARSGARSTIRGAQRKKYPGVYKSPEQLMDDVVVAPEDPMMGRLWGGVTREDLAKTSERPGTMLGEIPNKPKNPKGSKAAEPIMKPANTDRLVEGLQYARDTPLGTGMRGWYVMDPMYQRLEELVGPEEAVRRYSKLNSLSGMASPGSDVLTEINRGSAANMLDESGRFGDFMKYGGGTVSGGPEDMAGVLGHMYHKTAQGLPMQQYLDSGSLQMKSPKVPLYIQASGVPETGFQTDFPVGDAHWSRAVGLADTRTNANPGASYTTPEAMSLHDWWRDDVAGQAGLESVPGQALAWGLYSPQTGVKTPVGAPKLELWSQQIKKAADRLGISPEEARDKILMGKEHAGFVDPAMLKWLGLAGGAGYIGSGLLGKDVEESEAAQAFKPRQY